MLLLVVVVAVVVAVVVDDDDDDDGVAGVAGGDVLGAIGGGCGYGIWFHVFVVFLSQNPVPFENLSCYYKAH